MSWNGPPSNPTRPNEFRLKSIFYAKRTTFEKLHSMAVEEEGKSFFIGTTDLDSSGLRSSRVSEYRHLLTSVGSNVDLIVNDHIMKIVFESGGSSLPTGSQWSYGIEFISEDFEKHGNIVKDIDKVDLDKEEISLVPIDSHWFIFYQNY